MTDILFVKNIIICSLKIIDNSNNTNSFKYYEGTNIIHSISGPVTNSTWNCWMQHGKFHRIDGPSLYHPCGKYYWVINDNVVNNYAYEKIVL